MQQKTHKNLVKAIASGVERIFDGNQYADQVVEKVLSSDSRFGSRDRRFLAENLYNIVRYFRRLELVENTLIGTEEPPLDWLSLVSAYLYTQGLEDIAEWEEFEDLHFEKLKMLDFNSPDLPLVYRASIPDWLDELGKLELPNRWDAEINALNNPAPIYLRANTLKTDSDELIEILKGEGIETEKPEIGSAPDALMLKDRTNVLRLGSFRKGLYEVQDLSSQLIAPFLEPQPGETVIDACSGAGGKALHLAALMQNEGKIIAMDIEGWKLEELKKRASRNGVKIVETRPIEGGRSLKKLEESADRLLLDAPCSGLGVLRRNPDSKWKLNPESVERVKEVQYDILNKYHKMLKKGGTMVYATCSIMPAENEEQVATFLSEHKNFELIKEHRSWPTEGFDGFYMAQLKKKA